MNLLSQLMTTLAPYPDARAAAAKLAEELAAKEKRRGEPSREEITKHRRLTEESN
jgi:hypothetical protein